MKKTPLVLFGNMKGGSGKTTTTILTALAYAHAGYRVGLRDCDNQSSLGTSLYHEAFAGLPVDHAPTGSEENYDIVLSDGPPRLNDSGFLAEFDRCTLFILVTGTSTLDLQPTAKAYAQLSARRPETPVYIVVNRYDDRTSLDRHFEEHLATVGLAQVPVIKPYLRESEVYRHVVYGGWQTAARQARRPVGNLQTETAELATQIYRLAQKHLDAAERRRSA